MLKCQIGAVAIWPFSGLSLSLGFSRPSLGKVESCLVQRLGRIDNQMSSQSTLWFLIIHTMVCCCFFGCCGDKQRCVKQQRYVKERRAD